ncbi:MAG: hypothetical protein EHM80_08695 [Nitrospiraceae bacterium]|nr:MAG: hypothetical protein EHM80_08695 [Nitrospiraceae bacterium]
MLTTNQKKVAAVVGLGLLWGGVFAWEWLTVEDPVRVPLTNVSGLASTPRPTRGRVEGLHVQLDFLAAARTQREMTFTPPRNIFAPPRAEDSGTAFIDRPEFDAGSEQALRQQAALAGLALFHYLGFVRMEGGVQKKGEMAVLTKKDDLHVVRAGETVEDHVVVKAITQESVTLQDRQSRVEHIVLLSEEAPLEEAPLQP